MKAATPFARVIQRIKPGATGKDLATILGRDVNRTTALDWVSGRRNPPAWAIERVRQRWHAIETAARADFDAMQPGPGFKAGAANLARYLANRNR